MYTYHTLNNGIKIIIRHNGSPVTHAGLYVNIGSRDERGHDEGMAHFIEHSIFKGTEHRRSWHILNRIDGVGGELNAFTTKEETCIYSSSLTIHLERCLELIADIVFHSTFPEKEIEKEKEVVIEEINSYRDSPADLIYDDFEEFAFEGHPLAHNILGKARDVRHFSSKRLREFMRQRYTTDRMVVSIVGGVDVKKAIRLCEKYFGEQSMVQSVVDRGDTPVYHAFERTIHRRTHQMHIMVGGEAPSVYDERKVAFSLLNNILGGPAMNSRLNVAIRERYGFCYTIESQYTPFSDAGLFYIYAGIENGGGADSSAGKERFMELLHKELKSLGDTLLTATQLHGAKRQYVGQMAINNEVSLNEMQSIGKAYLSFDHVDTLEEMQRDIEAVTASELMTLAHDLFAPSNLSTLTYQ